MPVIDGIQTFTKLQKIPEGRRAPIVLIAAAAKSTHLETYKQLGALGTIYLAIILDLFSKKIVGWAMRDHMKTELVMAALMRALQRQKPKTGFIHHSDRGSQYASHAYRDALNAAGAVQSMSRKGDCWDNAPAESFFHTLKTELVHHKHYATKKEAKRDLFTYIEGYYNSRRIHSSIGYVTPVEIELNAL